MATTYSTSLKIALIGDGEQAGIWGQTTNTNLGTLLEQAITGVQTITMVDANYTLTNFNGVPDEARNPVLVITGTNTAVRDVIAPLVNKQYLIYNNTSGGFAIRIRGSSGFTVTIPNGANIPVYCDGTNFYSAELNATTGNITINGNATVTGNVATNQNIVVGKTLSGTYSQSGTTVTVTATSHGLVAGNPISVDISSGTGVDGTYSVATVTGTNTFTYTAGTSLTTSGSITVVAIGNLTVYGSTSLTSSVSVVGTLAANVATFAQDSSFNSTGAVKISAGTTGQRPATPQAAMFRYNSSNSSFEGFSTVAGQNVTSMTYVTTTATVVTDVVHGLSNSSYIVMSGASPAAYNGTFPVTLVNASAFTYTMLSDPGANASPVGSYLAGTWSGIGGGGAATGGGDDQIFVENGQTITTSYSIPVGKNASTVSPITINSGIVVTVPGGSRWVVL
jgi:hypothetical protein